VKRFVFGLVAVFLAASGAQAWNDKGHMVVARLAWNELTADERTKVIAILKKHPHFDEFLKAHRPANIPEDEWVFLRAATWSDWVRPPNPHSGQFHHAPWHFTNNSFVQPGSAVTPPGAVGENVVKQITLSKQIAKSGGDQAQRAIHTCWIFHLVGDIHQPMHCITLFGDDFPEGDRGGNRSLFRLDGHVIHMHHFWDGLLGSSTTLSSIGGTVHEIETMLQHSPNSIHADLQNHKTPELWANESFELGKQFGYLDGHLKPANIDEHPTGSTIPTAPSDYAENAGEVARTCAAKAGKRLAEAIREILAAN
jgi:hypothetical protein